VDADGHRPEGEEDTPAVVLALRGNQVTPEVASSGQAQALNSVDTVDLRTLQPLSSQEYWVSSRVVDLPILKVLNPPAHCALYY